MKQEISKKAVHRLPSDLKQVLEMNHDLLEKWRDLTPLARNEWICWITIVKTKEIREKHIKRLESNLLQGKRRPCCWPGCPHRNKNTAKWFRA